MTSDHLSIGSELWRRLKFFNQINAVRKSITDSQEEIPKPEFYQFVTFTAKHGRPLSEQIAENAAGHRFGHGPNAGARSAMGGKSGKFPKMTDDAIRKWTAGKEQVPEGHIRQYFCRVEKMRTSASVVAEIEIPDVFWKPKVSRAGQKTNMEMRRDKKFWTHEIDTYLHSIYSECQDLSINLTKSLEEASSKDDARLHGAEKISESATDRRSEGGLLLVNAKIESWPKNTPDEGDLPIFCPFCTEELLDAFSSGQIERIPFPPLPTIPTAFTNRLFCTENRHKNHKEQDCISLIELCRRINLIRSDLGYKKHNVEFVDATGTAISESGIIWIDSRILPR